MKMKCIYCGRDLDKIGQDNMSEIPNEPICEDCFNDGRRSYEYDDIIAEAEGEGKCSPRSK
jgi:hypothetical protein